MYSKTQFLTAVFVPYTTVFPAKPKSELYENFEIYDSVLDMVAKYRQTKIDNGSDLQDDEIQRMIAIVTGIRKQWEEHQRNLRRGEQVARSEVEKMRSEL